ncbi:MAG TPA: TetR/AcrR family transcriptional regulator [Mycobacteriales bacterium]|nr:TetR/AcrR family transcriptional regulator [Mycobacteriales bacterium]
MAGAAGDTRTALVQTMARLLREQGYAATALAQVLAESGASNGSLYHYFPGGMEELAEVALQTSGKVVAGALRKALDAAPDTAAGLSGFLDMSESLFAQQPCGGCPISPTALESPTVSPRLRLAATNCFQTWQALIAASLRSDGWAEDTVHSAASAALALVEGALLLARVSGQLDHLENARRGLQSLLARPQR